MIRTLKNVARSLREGVRRLVKRNQLRARSRTEQNFGRLELGAAISQLGIRRGDVVFLHSSLKSIGYVDGGPTALFEALSDVVGPEGTIILPTYYLPGGTVAAAAANAEYVFDPSIHGSKLGALPAAFLKFPGIRRSLHPTHSVSAVGRHAEYVTKDHHTAPSIFGDGSPWQRFVELNGKLLGIGISLGPVTFYHRIEDEMDDAFPVPVRHAKAHLLRAKDAAGVVHRIPVRAFDPVYSPRRIDFPARKDLRDYLWRDFAKAGLLTVGSVGKAKSWWMQAQPLHDHLMSLASEGMTIYATAEELDRRGWAPLDANNPPPE